MSTKDIELLRDQAEKILEKEYDLDHKSITYDQFCHELKLANGLEVEKLAKDAKYNCGKDFLVAIGFTFDENNDIVISPLEEETVYPPAESKPWGPPVHIFDGDESKLHPGMYVKIATGKIHTEHSRKVQQRAGEQYLKKVRYIVRTHEKMKKTMELMYGKKDVQQ